MTTPSSFNVSGLLGSNAIDTTTLVSQLVQAAAIPQTQLKSQLTVEQSVLSTYQSVNTKVTAVQTAANTLLDPTAWTATTASSSNSAVVASSSSSALVGTTTFDVTSLASAQVSTTLVGAGSTVVSNPSLPLTVTGADGIAHQITLGGDGSATGVASAINAAGLNIHANIISTAGGQILQLTSTNTGAAGAFSISGLDNPVSNIVTAKDAAISVGDPNAGGYTITSSTNTFANAIPGVTFSVGAVASGVTISVSSDPSSIAAKVKSLVDAVNAASSEIGSDTGQGGVLAGHYEVNNLLTNLMSAVSKGGPNGVSLSTYGIDMDKNGVLSFDSDTFTAALAADPTGTQAAVSGAFATSLKSTSDAATAPVTGSITQQITAATDESTDLNKQIDVWTSRLADIQTNLQAKYSAMQATLAKLQSQSTYLTSMLKSATDNSSSSSSS